MNIRLIILLNSNNILKPSSTMRCRKYMFVSDKSASTVLLKAFRSD